MSQIRVMGGGVKLIETMSQNMQFFFWTASLSQNSWGYEFSFWEVGHKDTDQTTTHCMGRIKFSRIIVLVISDKSKRGQILWQLYTLNPPWRTVYRFTSHEIGMCCMSDCLRYWPCSMFRSALLLWSWWLIFLDTGYEADTCWLLRCDHCQHRADNEAKQQ